MLHMQANVAAPVVWGDMARVFGSGWNLGWKIGLRCKCTDPWRYQFAPSPQKMEPLVAFFPCATKLMISTRGYAHAGAAGGGAHAVGGAHAGVAAGAAQAGVAVGGAHAGAAVGGAQVGVVIGCAHAGVAAGGAQADTAESGARN